MADFLFPELLDWLLDGDISLQYHVRRYLLNESSPGLVSIRKRIAVEGWGRKILERQRPDGDWGEAYYQPKWTSTHYTVLELMHLGIPPDTPGPRRAVEQTINRYLGEDGGLYFAGGGTVSDDCVVGMFLQTAVYFNAEKASLERMMDFLINRVLSDGAWNCRSARSPCTHSSVHTTISCLEAFRLFRNSHPSYRPAAVKNTMSSAEEFLLKHQLCKSHRSGEIMDSRMLKLSWPTRWYFDILRGLEYFADSGRRWDNRLSWSMKAFAAKRRKDGRWPVQNRHPGESHIQMEKTGGPSRWNTFRALKVMRAYGSFIKTSGT
jgi:hypothetical protein